MHPTAGQWSGGTSAGSFPSPKSVACTIATSDGRPDPAQSVRHARARPSVSALPRTFTSFRGGVDGWSLRSVWPKIWLPSSDSTVHRLLAFPWRVTRALAARSTELAEILAKDRRKGEIISLTWADVDRDAGSIRLRPEASKNGKGRSAEL